MPNDITPRNYKLPHPDNIAAQDVVRIREAFLQVDADISQQEVAYNNLKQAFIKLTFETFLDLWAKK
jgi:hypothetical protein